MGKFPLRPDRLRIDRAVYSVVNEILRVRQIVAKSTCVLPSLYTCRRLRQMLGVGQPLGCSLALQPQARQT